MKLNSLYILFILTFSCFQGYSQINNEAPSYNLNRSEDEKTLENDKNLTGESYNIQKENVSELVYKKKNKTWYNQQILVWRQEIEINKKNAEAWLNYYKASKYAGVDDEILDQIVTAMNINIPNSFQSHYVNYIHSNRDLSKGTELMKAYLIEPNRKEIYKELAVYFVLKGDNDNLDKTLKKWNSLNEIPQSLKDYSYNLLNTIPQNGILITDGEYDTYPLWILQSAEGHRKDVKILNLNIIENNDYRKRICLSYGLTCSDNVKNKSSFVLQLVQNNTDKSFYFSYTVDQPTLALIENNLYNEGLAYRFHKTPYDNSTRLKNNWELIYKTDYLNGNIRGNDSFSNDKINSLHLNYVSSGLELYDIYKETGEINKANKLYQILLKLAKNAGKENSVKSYIEN